MKPITHIINLSNTAPVKISVTKITPTNTFTKRDSIDTPPAITDYVRDITPIIKNHNEIKAHFRIEPEIDMRLEAENNDTLICVKIYRDPSKIRPLPSWVIQAMPADGKRFGRIYYADGNTNRADKPAFRNDSTIFFDSLSEDYSA